MSPFATKISKSICSQKETLKKFSECIFRQPKCHQRKIRSETGISLENILNYLAKILNLEIAPILFILIGVFCEFSMATGMYIPLSAQEEEFIELDIQ